MATESEPTLAEIRREDPFSDSVRKERRSFLWFSSVAIFIWLTGTLPSRIPSIGVDTIEPNQQKWIIVALGAVILYLWIGFLMNSLGEAKAWTSRLREAERVTDNERKNIQHLGEELERMKVALPELEKLTSNLRDEANQEFVHGMLIEWDPGYKQPLEKAVGQPNYLKTLSRFAQKRAATFKSEIVKIPKRIEGRSKKLKQATGSYVLHKLRWFYDFWFPMLWGLFAMYALYRLYWTLNLPLTVLLR